MNFINWQIKVNFKFKYKSDKVKTYLTKKIDMAAYKIFTRT